jgi:aminopeptidase N
MAIRPSRPALLFTLLALAPLTGAVAQGSAFTRADTLRGSITPERAWWDVTFYDLHVTINPADSTIRGRNGISYRVTDTSRDLQIDLQAPLDVDSIVQDGRRLAHRRDGNVVLVTPATPQRKGSVQTVVVYYHGKPKVAANAPWEGGFVWARDGQGKPWAATASQLTGASVWWPNKDTQADEPDSQRVALTVPDSLQAVANGRLHRVTRASAGWKTYEWFVAYPINNYAVAAYVGRYGKLTDTYDGQRGKLSLTYWPLAEHRDTARRHFKQVKTMMACFERWFGPYPWYPDGYQLVEAPFLGMEHQSAVAYGNRYLNGYRGTDVSGTGLGLTWDYIIVHESAHEWWGNNITAADAADMWVHESFASYAEGLFVECQQGTAAGASYLIGTRSRVKNDAPIVGPHGVNARGSDDMYYKGANMWHTIRHIIGDDPKWRSMLRYLHITFWHRIITGQRLQDRISGQARIDLSKVFAQYLTTTKIPVFEYSVDGQTVKYRWTDVVPGFDMPLRINVAADSSVLLAPREAWQTTTIPNAANVEIDKNFYVVARRVQ